MRCLTAPSVQEARLSVNHGQFELQLDYSDEYDEKYPENNLDTILTDNLLNDSLIFVADFSEEYKVL